MEIPISLGLGFDGEEFDLNETIQCNQPQISARGCEVVLLSLTPLLSLCLCLFVLLSFVCLNEMSCVGV